jgi:hypothetical protein
MVQPKVNLMRIGRREAAKWYLAGGKSAVPKEAGKYNKLFRKA